MALNFHPTLVNSLEFCFLQDIQCGQGKVCKVFNINYNVSQVASCVGKLLNFHKMPFLIYCNALQIISKGKIKRNIKSKWNL